MQACLDNTGRLLQATGSRPSMTDLLRSHGSGSSMFRPECSSVSSRSKVAFGNFPLSVAFDTLRQ